MPGGRGLRFGVFGHEGIEPAALDVDQATVERLAQEDLREWAAWANEPIRPYLVARAMAAIYCPVQLPDEIQSVEQAQDYASQFARHWRIRVCLVLSRRISIYYQADGSIEEVTEAVPGDEPNQPYTLIGGRRCMVRPTERGIARDQVRWCGKSRPKND